MYQTGLGSAGFVRIAAGNLQRKLTNGHVFAPEVDLTAEISAFVQIDAVGSAGSYGVAERVLADEGACRYGNKALRGQQISHLQERIVEITVAVNSGDDNGGAFSVQMTDGFVRNQRDASAVNGSADHDHLVRFEGVVLSTYFGTGQVEIFDLGQNAAGDGLHRFAGGVGGAEVSGGDFIDDHCQNLFSENPSL